MAVVMEKIEDFYFGEGEESGEAMFKAFADKHAHHFKNHDPSNESAEHKLE